MIAACPKCQTRYRIETERLGPDGARLRCSQCSAVFRVRLPETTPTSVATVEPVLETISQVASLSANPPRSEAKPSEAHQARAPEGTQPRSAEGRSVTPTVGAFAGAPEAPQFDHARLVVIAHPNADACKRLAESLEREGLQVLVAHDGVEAILSIQRALPRAVVLDAALPKMFGFQVCELVKRNESLRVIHVCLMGAIHKDDRYRRAPNEIYGADFYVEPPALPGALIDWLGRVGLPMRSRAGRVEALEPTPRPTEAPSVEGVTIEDPATQAARSGANLASAGAAGAGARSEPQASEAHQARGPEGTQPRSAEGRSVTRTAEPLVAPAGPAPAKLTLGRVAAPADPLTAERAQAERLARIIVSDIVLYNEEKFTAAIRSGNALEALQGELEEGRALFRERIDARIREERDFLADELERVARTRGMA